jgi:phosphocarrier protein HPr
MKVTKKLKIKNDLGLHIRPATYIAKILQSFNAQVYFTYKSETVNARSIMSILMLTAKKNAIINVSATGEDAEDVIACLSDAFDNYFGEKN